MMTRFFTLLYAALFLGLGICSWIAPLQPDGELFGVWRIGPVQAILYLLFGLSALAVSLFDRFIQIHYFQVMGILLALWAVLGFAYGSARIFRVIESHPPVTWLHVITGVVALILGFGASYEEKR